MVSAIILLLAVLIAGLVVGVFLVALNEFREMDQISEQPAAPRPAKSSSM